MKAREPRRKVLVHARMQSGSAWIDVRIENMSSRGLLARSTVPPDPGTYVDIRRGSHVIIGRAMWRHGQHFGVRTQDRIDIEAIVNEPARQARPKAAEPEGDRRQAPRVAGGASSAYAHERSRRVAAALQFAAFAGGGLMVAAALAHSVAQVLMLPFSAVERSLL